MERAVNLGSQYLILSYFFPLDIYFPTPKSWVLTTLKGFRKHSGKLMTTLFKKKIILATSIFFSSTSVFKSALPTGWNRIVWLWFSPFPNKPLFLRVCNTSLLKTLWNKEKLLVMNNFSFSHSFFYPFEKLSIIFIKSQIVICNLFQFGRVHNLSFENGFSLSNH